MNKETLVALAEKKLHLCSGSLCDFRQTHLELFKQHAFKADPEAYKFTNFNSFMEALEYTPQEPNTDVNQYLDSNFINLIFVDGALVNSKTQIKGLKTSKISDSFKDIAFIFQNTNPVAHLHHALLESGIVLELEKNTKLDQPLRLVNIVTRSGVVAPTFLLRANAHSEVSFIEEYIDLNVGHAGLNESYVLLEAGARVEHIQLTRGGETALNHTETKVQVFKDATYRNVILNLSGKLNRNNLYMELLEPGAHGESYNLYLTTGTEHSDINTRIEHKAADSTSDQIAKGILDGNSKGIFTGKIHIHPQTQRVNSGQINKNLLLSQKAQAHSQPQLEIFADDVKCSHGSTTGQLSDDEVFYFQARGIPADKARTLLAHAFGIEVVLKIRNKHIRNHVESMVMEALKTKFNLGGAL